ncbi:pyrimidine reductase family protein [Corynebacterium pilosum]|uniref:Putative riboflavin specific deaminase n=1 Tax=Corynebacterium pilosum TaxID=35756 RepID=A0A376CR76_9CORY|nr:pyrimidine reductase family protein [Corynebacterium pilosum]STC70589.1 putative riboflavin specific deaminase [Corynebacterium pilosum]
MTIASSFTAADLVGPTLPAATPELRAVAITTLSGASAWDGSSHDLGNPTDEALLLGLRDWAQCILVGANTIRAESYGAPATPIAVVSRSLDFDTTSPFFTAAQHSPLILCPHSSLYDESLVDKRDALEAAGATLVDTSSGSAEEMVEAVRNRGYHRVTCEGGPGIYSMMFNADLVDVFHLTIDPLMHGPVEKHLLAPRPDGTAFEYRMELEDLRATDDSVLFLRYRRVR